MKGKHEKTHEATKRILSEKVEYQGALEKTIAGLRGEIAKYDERFRQANEKIAFIEEERLPQNETSVKNALFSLDIHRDALQRLKETTARSEVGHDRLTKLIEEANSLARETLRKLNSRVACETYDIEMQYIKTVMRELRGEVQEILEARDNEERAFQARMQTALHQQELNAPLTVQQQQQTPPIVRTPIQERVSTPASINEDHSLRDRVHLLEAKFAQFSEQAKNTGDSNMMDEIQAKLDSVDVKLESLKANTAEQISHQYIAISEQLQLIPQQVLESVKQKVQKPAIQRLSKIEAMLELAGTTEKQEESSSEYSEKEVEFNHDDPFQNVPGLKKPTNAIEELKQHLNDVRESLTQLQINNLQQQPVQQSKSLLNPDTLLSHHFLKLKQQLTPNYSQQKPDTATKEEISSIKQQIEDISARLDQGLRAFEKHMRNRPENGKLLEVEQRLLNLLNDQVTLLTAKLTDTQKIQPRVSKLEQTTKRFQDFVIEQLAAFGLANGLNAEGDSSSPDTGAMLQKRPLTSGWACGSCDRELINLQTKQADFTPWMKLPEKQRLAPIGPGFSKLLQKVKPEQLVRSKSQVRVMRVKRIEEGMAETPRREESSGERDNNVIGQGATGLTSVRQQLLTPINLYENNL
ncbi:hypothetical protein FGO68_gene9405 [Halteria grandinella]|uniref:Uncharacterized protein n=1 Tax=Halteria grandinella TaxID=5974 RepID=A0A8J8NYU0_HALGN|nr:hypothetical protein FGO68_gene9405 [Halteria grandinella]